MCILNSFFFSPVVLTFHCWAIFCNVFNYNTFNCLIFSRSDWVILFLSAISLNLNFFNSLLILSCFLFWMFLCISCCNFFLWTLLIVCWCFSFSTKLGISLIVFFLCNCWCTAINLFLWVSFASASTIALIESSSFNLIFLSFNK